MIPDFKTYLRESIWSDMQDRGTGDVIKKEDDIDLMDIEDFKAYLKKRYICTKSRRRWKVDSWFLGGENTLMQVDMPIEDISEPGIKITYCLRLTYDYGKMECIDISSSYQTFFEEYPEFKKYVSDNYQLIKKSKDDFRLFVSDNLIVSKPGKELKFHDYVELVDKALSCVKKPYLKRVMNESVWSDMQERGTGDMTKREDDIDLLDRYDFFAYLNKIYRTTPPSKIRNYDELNSILVPLFGVNRAPLPSKHLSIEMEYNDGQNITVGKMLMSNFPQIEADLRDSFNVEDMPAGEMRGEYLKIHPKDGSPVTNSFFITVIDFLLEKARDKYTIILFKK